MMNSLLEAMEEETLCLAAIQAIQVTMNRKLKVVDGHFDASLCSVLGNTMIDQVSDAIQVLETISVAYTARDLAQNACFRAFQEEFEAELEVLRVVQHEEQQQVYHRLQEDTDTSECTVQNEAKSDGTKETFSTLQQFYSALYQNNGQGASNEAETSILEDQEQYEEIIQDLELKVDHYMDENRRLQKEASRMKFDHMAALAEADIERDRVVTLTVEMDEMRNKCAKLDEQLSRNQKKCKELEQEIDDLRGENSDLRDIVRSKDKKIEQLQKSLEERTKVLDKDHQPEDHFQKVKKSQARASQTEKTSDVVPKVSAELALLETIESLRSELEAKEVQVEQGQEINRQIAQRLIQVNADVDHLLHSSSVMNKTNSANNNKSAMGSKVPRQSSAKERREAERRKDLGKRTNKRQSLNLASFEEEPSHEQRQTSRPELQELDRLEEKLNSAVQNAPKNIQSEINQANANEAGAHAKGSRPKYTSASTVITRSNNTINRSPSANAVLNSNDKSHNVPRKNSLTTQEKQNKLGQLEREQAHIESEIRRLRNQVKRTEPGNESGQSPEMNGSVEDLKKIVKQELNQSEMLDQRLKNKKRDLKINDELDDLCGLIVSQVLDRVKANPDLTGLPGDDAAQDSRELKKCFSEDVIAKDNEVIKLRHDLQEQRHHLKDLQNAVRSERQKSLEWMERHNRERDSRRLLEAELAELNGRMSDMKAKSSRDLEEMQRLEDLLNAERKQCQRLEEAWRNERESFRRVRQTLEEERSRSKAASERDSETILELRTALEIERERPMSQSQGGPPPPARPALPEGFGCIDDAGEGGPLPPPDFIIQQLEMELRDERQRVDDLKHCLELEREKSELLVMAAQASGDHSLQHEWIVFNQRRFEALEVQRAQMLRDLQRQRVLNSRMSEEISHLRGQLRSSGVVSVSKSFEHFYVKDLEAKVDAYREREMTLTDEVERARLLVQNLQKENAMLVEREKELIAMQDDCNKMLAVSGPGPVSPPTPEAAWNPEGDQLGPNSEVPNELSSEMQKMKMKRIMEVNETLQDKVKLLENRIERLKDDLEMENEARALFVKRENSTDKKIKEELKVSLDTCERHRQSLVWQKQFLLLLLNTHVRSFRPKSKNARNESVFYFSFPYIKKRTPLVKFRIGAFAVRAKCRLFNMMTWRRDKKLQSLSENAVDADKTEENVVEDVENIENDENEVQKIPGPDGAPLLTTDL